MFCRIAFYLCVLQLAAISPLYAQSRDPVALWFWGDNSPATTAGVPNNLAMKGAPFTATYRTYYRLREEGNLSLSVWYRNIMDSQSEHPLADPANDSCSYFGIIAAYVADGGSAPDGSVAPGSTRPVTFGGSAAKTVTKGESFWSDAVDFSLPSGHYLAFTWTVQKLTADDAIPHPYENQYSCFTKSGSYASQELSSGFSATGDFAVAPNAIAYKKPVKKIIGVIGNSITQGFNVSMDSYAFWVAQAAINLGPDYGVWNLGSGWAQARDAATNKAWLGKVKCCDDAVICLGVNDLRNGATADQVLGYITTVVNSLLQLSPAKKIILCTVPPFNFTGAAETNWRAINTAIRTNPPMGVARVFDLAALLGQSPPNDNLANPAYGDGHPNNSGGKFVGKEFADFYLNTGKSNDSVVIDTTATKASAFSVLWDRTFPLPGKCFAHSICQTTDGGFALAGSSRDSSGTSKALLLTTDCSGNAFDWRSLWDGSGVAYDCRSTFNGGVVIGGFSAGPANGENILASKYDSLGNELFHVSPQGVGSAKAYAVIQLPDSGYAFAGCAGLANTGDTGVAIYKIDKNGTLVFAKTFHEAGWNCCYALVSAKNGGCVIAGGTFSHSENGGKDVFLAKLDSLGSIAWTKIFGGSGNDVAYNLASTSDGGFAVTGSTTSFGSGQKAFFLKTDSLGNYQWSKTAGGSATNAAYGVVQTPDGGFMVAANMPSYSSDSAAVVITTDALGDSIGILKFKGFISPGGSPLLDAGTGNYALCYTSAMGADTGVGIALLGGMRAMGGGAGYSFVLKTNGALSDWGWDLFGQLGDGATNNRLTPIQIASAMKSISASSYHTLMLGTDNTLWGCGENCYGQLGDGTMFNRYAPIQIATGIQSMAAGHYFSLFLKTDGTLWACGDNSYGQFGDETMNNRLTPIQIMTGVKSIAAGGYHSLILKTDNTLWACGSNQYGQLGDGTTTNRPRPIQIMTGVQSMAAGLYHSLFLKIDGTLLTCGDNEYGQLGDGTTANRNAPTLIMTNAQNAAMSVGYYHNLVLKSDGTLWGWGYNGYGQLGDATTENRPAPVQIMSGVLQIGSGSQHNLMLKTDGTLWTCGWNYYGQLGDGTTIDRHSPIKVSY